MTEAEKIICKMYLENYGKYKDCNEYKLLMGLLEQELCEDAISRAYIEPFVEELENICINGDEHVLDILSNIKNAPPVTPKQKVGKWIRVDKDKLKCSECKVIHFIAQYPQSANINFCPNCGAKMEVSKYE